MADGAEFDAEIATRAMVQRVGFEVLTGAVAVRQHASWQDDG